MNNLDTAQATTNDRLAGLALIVASLASLLVMALHPTGHDLFHSGRFQSVLYLSTGVHILALCATPLMFFGALGLSRRLLIANSTVLCAIIFYAFSLIAVINAAIMSGLVNSSVARMMASSTPPESDTWSVLFHYTGRLNQSYALVYVVGSSVAIGLWSLFMARTRALSFGTGVYGCILSPFTILVALSGHLRLDVHGFGAIVLTQSIWFILVGQRLWRKEQS